MGSITNGQHSALNKTLNKKAEMPLIQPQLERTASPSVQQAHPISMTAGEHAGSISVCVCLCAHARSIHAGSMTCWVAVGDRDGDSSNCDLLRSHVERWPPELIQASLQSQESHLPRKPISHGGGGSSDPARSST